MLMLAVPIQFFVGESILSNEYQASESVSPNPLSGESPNTQIQKCSLAKVLFYLISEFMAANF
jgi:hypothetical protein